MATPIAEDFAAIRARLMAIRAAETPRAVPAREAEPTEPPPPSQARPEDFYAWLTGGGLWGLAPDPLAPAAQGAGG